MSMHNMEVVQLSASAWRRNVLNLHMRPTDSQQTENLWPCTVDRNITTVLVKTQNYTYQ